IERRSIGSSSATSSPRPRPRPIAEALPPRNDARRGSAGDQVRYQLANGRWVITLIGVHIESTLGDTPTTLNTQQLQLRNSAYRPKPATLPDPRPACGWRTLLTRSG